MKISIKKYLIYSSIFAIFTEAFFFNFIIDWKLIYLILLINYVILIKIRKISLNIYFVYLMLFFLVHGIIMYIIIGITPNYLISQIIGITIISTYYYNFIPLYKKEEIINIYLKLSVWVASIGYLLMLLGININDGRLQSIFKEPAHYAIVVVPACYYLLKTKKYLSFTIVFGSLILSQSSIGYIGCALMFILTNISLKRVKYFLITIPLLIIAFIFVYNNFIFLKLRVDDTYETLSAVNTGIFKPQTNQSSYAILSNAFIANKNVQDHPFGSGLGSHFHMHTKVYLKQMRPPPFLVTLKSEKINAPDAASLFLRLISETGIIGFFLIVYLLYLSSKSYLSDNHYFAQGIFIYLLLKLFRDGHYFPPEFFFFIWMIYYSFKNEIHETKNTNSN